MQVREIGHWLGGARAPSSQPQLKASSVIRLGERRLHHDVYRIFKLTLEH